MARLRVSYQDPNGRGHYLDFFTNFINSVEIPRGKDVWEVVYETLQSEYNAHGVRLVTGIMEIEFPNPEDITTFLVRWS